MPSSPSSAIGAVLLAILVTAGCRSQPRYITLPSGKKAEFISLDRFDASVMSRFVKLPAEFSDGGPVQRLTYYTLVPLSDSEDLQKEVEEVWSVYMHDVERAGLYNAIIRAHDTPHGPLVPTGKYRSFAFKRSPGQTTWRLVEDSGAPSAGHN